MNAIHYPVDGVVRPETVKTIVLVSDEAFRDLDLKSHAQLFMQAAAEREIERLFKDHRVIRIEHGKVELIEMTEWPIGRPLEKPQHYAVLRTEVYAVPEVKE